MHDTCKILVTVFPPLVAANQQMSEFMHIWQGSALYASTFVLDSSRELTKLHKLGTKTQAISENVC
jgi:hypothetical protein